MTDDSALQLQLDEIADEFLARRRNGENPTIAEYQQRHPQLAEQIERSLKTILFVDNLNDDQPANVQTSDEISKIGDYKIVKKIGQGGMGVVYEATQESLGRRVALKVLPQHFANDEKFVGRFKREARAAAKLHHTNIVPVFEVGQSDGTLYYAMQYIEGQTLDVVQAEILRIRTEGSNSLDSTATKLIGGTENSNVADARAKRTYFKSIAALAANVADALEYAHQRSIIHRDVKPSNLILDTQGVVWLTDFGLAKTTDSELTETGDFIGTARYMSPERFKGQADQRADIYGLGLTLYELATLKRAYDADDRYQLIERISSTDARKPSELERSIPLDLETIVLKTIDRDPRRRYQSAAALSEDLRRFVDGQPIKARRASTFERAMRWMQRHKAQTAAMASMFLAIVALIGGTYTTLQQRNIARNKESLAKKEEKRADAEAVRSKRSATVTVEALTTLVESVQTEMRNFPELLELKEKILTSAQEKLDQVVQLEDDSSELIQLKIRALTTLGELNYEVGHYQECEDYFNQALNLADQLPTDIQNQYSIFKSRSEIYWGLGSMAFEKNEEANSRKYYQLGYENNLAWTKLDESVDSLTYLAKSADAIGDTYALLAQPKWDEAEQYHKEAFEIRKRARTMTDISSYQLDYGWANSHMKLGDMHYGRARNQDNPDEINANSMQTAQEWFLKAAEIVQGFTTKHPDEELNVQRLLAAIYERIADTYTAADAQKYYMLSIEIKEKMAPKLGLDRNFQRDLAVSWGLAAMHSHAEKNFENAETYMQRCLDIFNELVERIPDDTGLVIDLMMTWYQIGKIKPDDDQRLEAWQKALEIGNELIQVNKIKSDFWIYKTIQNSINELNKSKKATEEIEND